MLGQGDSYNWGESEDELKAGYLIRMNKIDTKSEKPVDIATDEAYTKPRKTSKFVKCSDLDTYLHKATSYAHENKHARVSRMPMAKIVGWAFRRVVR